jgi:anti-sigma factor RsiW
MEKETLMHCTPNTMIRFVRGEVTPGTATKVRKHAATCTMCSGFIARAMVDEVVMQALMEPFTLDEVLNALKASRKYK